ncbi:hypothetical protein [Sedimenticola sp.]|uniref:hypothetical protein n=1 Tax=Sedimenticola sp. TaxID=1940285 RepID=UPI003D0EA24E
MESKIIVRLFWVMLMFGLVGCGSTNTATKPDVEITAQFKIESINFKFEQLVKPEAKYHTPAELEQIFKNKVVALMKEKQLLSDKPGMNKLKINASYQRRFVGDETPAPSDALAYPHYSYKIDILDGTKNIVTVSKDNLTFKGGMMMNLQVIAASLRDKKYEVEFVEALAEGVVERIEDL